MRYQQNVIGVISLVVSSLYWVVCFHVYQLSIPMNNLLVGSELTKEPFRWDQRLFGVVLNIPAVHTPEAPVTQIPSAENAAIDAMADATGGRRN